MFKLNKATAGMAALCFTAALMSSTAVDAGQRQRGLVNVYVDDVLTHNDVAIPVAANIAANVCGTAVSVGVVAQALAHAGSYSCENTIEGTTVDITQ